MHSTPKLILPSFGEAVPEICERFVPGTVLAVLLFDLSVLAEIECDHGHEARVNAQAAFEELVRSLGDARLARGDLVLSGEAGRHELLVVMFREDADARFYRQEIPGFDSSLRRALARDANRIFYPYLREAPEPVSGFAVTLRNPRFGADTQVRRVIEEARADAELNVRIEARKQRRRFHELLLDHRVSSVYEPIVDVGSRTVFGYEALVRGPEGSDFHSPLELFRAADREGLVYELDCLCRAAGLEGAEGFPEGTKLFLNVLPTAIHDPNFRAERLIRTLESCALSPSDVVFEVSEQESIANFAAFREMRDYYRNLGFQFALDDTGSGYAGLEALLEISPEFIKIDRAFVSGVDEDPLRQDMLRALRVVAEKTGARIIGEGLDTLEELAMLGELGIHFGQGWLFGKPTPLKAR